jgi:hypothetical protein
MKRTIGIFIFVAQMTVGSHPTDAETPKSKLRPVVYAVEAFVTNPLFSPARDFHWREFAAIRSDADWFA